MIPTTQEKVEDKSQLIKTENQASQEEIKETPKAEVSGKAEEEVKEGTKAAPEEILPTTNKAEGTKAIEVEKQ